MTTLKHITVDLALGQTILVGPNDQAAKITKIEYHENSGEISLNTTRGPRKALTFKIAAISESAEQFGNPADKFR